MWESAYPNPVSDEECVSSRSVRGPSPGHPRSKTALAKPFADWDTLVDTLSTCLGDDRALAVEVLGDFTDCWAPIVEALEHAVANGDAAAVRSKAHELKGLLLNVELRSVAEIARTVELAGERGDLESCRQNCGQLRSALMELTISLREYLAYAQT